MITEWIRERRRLTEADRRGARLAELHHIAALTGEARPHRPAGMGAVVLVRRGR